MPQHATLTMLPEQGPLDERGRLLHAEDPAAQLALAVTRLEAALADSGLGLRDVSGIRVRTTDRRALDEVYDVLAERLTATGATPTVEVEEVARLGVPGMLLSLAARALPHVVRPPAVSDPHPSVSHTGTDETHEGTSMTSTEIPTTSARPADRLRGLCEGRLHLPGDPGYDAARLPWNVAVDQRPAAVAVPHSVEQVADTVRAAVAAGLRVAPQSTGHGAAPLVAGGSLDDVVVVRLAELTGVTVDPARRTARVLGGTLWRDVVAAAAEHGLAALHGSAGDVAVAGYALSGGLSFYGRRHGLAAGSITAVEVVTAAGELVRADATSHADLFWAVRGGGGNLGVVVAIELSLLPIPDVYAGMLLWDRQRAPEVVRAWAEWTRTVPESVTTSLRVMSFPPLPELPPFLSGRQIVVIDGALLEDDERAAELLAPLRALSPEMDTFGRIPAPGLLDVHMDPPGPSPAVGDHTVLAALTEETIEAFLGQVGPGTSTALLFAELRHLEGAVGRPDPDGGAVSHLVGAYAVLALAMAPVPEAVVAGLADARRLIEALRPWSTGTAVLTFKESGDDAATGFTPESWARLRSVRAAYDPAGALVASHRA